VSIGAEESQGIRRERQVELDMTVPAKREALQGYIATTGEDPAAVAELNERIRESGHTIIRTYAKESTSNTYGVDVMRPRTPRRARPPRSARSRSEPSASSPPPQETVRAI